MRVTTAIFSVTHTFTLEGQGGTWPVLVCSMRDIKAEDILVNGECGDQASRGVGAQAC